MTMWVVTLEYSTSADQETLDRWDDLLDAQEATVMPAADGGARVSVWTEGSSDPLDAALRARTLVATVIGGPPNRVSVMTAEDYEQQANAPTLPELVAGPEIGELLGITRQRVFQLQATDNFPAPLVRLRTGPVWDRRAIEAYAHATERRPRHRQVTAAG